MQRKLHIDIETFSSVDLRTSGVYKYAESPDFEILIMCYSIDDGDVVDVRPALGEPYPEEFLEAFHDKNTLKLAHNAMFERTCFRAVGLTAPIEEWECTAVKSLYCGLPASLEQVSNALDLGDKSKSAAGKALIKFFSVPLKNGSRNMPSDYPEKFAEYVEYCNQDVVAEMEIDKILSVHEVCDFERQNYFLDQHINDKGVMVDLQFAEAAFKVDEGYKVITIGRLKEITKLDNPNSPKQLTDWLNKAQKDVHVTSIAKGNLQSLREIATGAVAEVLELRGAISKTSVKKYTAMIAAACEDNYIRGCFQFYGANKTGRWAGRIVQFQNLPANRMGVVGNVDNYDVAREIIALNDLQSAEIAYGIRIPNILSELVRAALIAPEGKVFAVSDFAAIEARVLSWLAAEQWRMDVFASHGKIYEAAASAMFNVHIDEVTKSSDYRAKAKNAELALGYQGGVEAMRRMGGEAMGLSDTEMGQIVQTWRKVNPKIVQLWNAMNNYAIEAVAGKYRVETGFRGVAFDFDGKALKMYLPSGRSITYYDAKLKKNRFGSLAVSYKNIDQITKKWWDTDTYGGKLVENAVQAISRDILVYSMQNLKKADFEICIHVHDEIACEVDESIGQEKLNEMEAIMIQDIPWAEDLVLGADGFVTKYYKKD